MKVLEILTYPFRICFIGIIQIYKYCISPILPNTCRFTPTCSKYMELSIKEFGLFKGSWIGLKRLLRCRPKGGCGYDPIPLNIKGEVKWLF